MNGEDPSRSTLGPPRPAVHFGSLTVRAQMGNLTLRNSSYEGIGPNTWLGFPSSFVCCHPGVNKPAVRIKVSIRDPLFKTRKMIRLN